MMFKSFKHTVYIYQMNKQHILDLMSQADRMRNPIRKYMNPVVCVFDKPTPTLWSFQAAAMKLGCPVITLPEEQVHSAQAYGDMVLTNPETSEKKEEECLADLYALVKELEVRCIDLDSIQRDSLRVTFIGESSSVQAFAYLLQRFPKIDFHYVKQEIELSILEETDVFYVSQEGLVVDKAFLNQTKATSIFMRSQPYAETEIWHNPRCIYSKQEAHGVYMRMAILDQSLSKLSWPTVYEACWMVIDIFLCQVTNLVCYVTNGWSIFTGSPLVSTGV